MGKTFRWVAPGSRPFARSVGRSSSKPANMIPLLQYVKAAPLQTYDPRGGRPTQFLSADLPASDNSSQPFDAHS
jgi:hypothetical protein